MTQPTVQTAEEAQVRERLRDETEITHLIRVYADEVRKRNSCVGAILSVHAPYINEILEAHLTTRDSAIRADEREKVLEEAATALDERAILNREKSHDQNTDRERLKFVGLWTGYECAAQIVRALASPPPPAHKAGVHQWVSIARSRS